MNTRYWVKCYTAANFSAITEFKAYIAADFGALTENKGYTEADLAWLQY